MRGATRHVDDLLRSARGDAAGRDPLIRQSWRRCLDEYRLDPVAPRRAYIHTNQRLREHRDAMDDLISVARFGVETLYKQVSGLGYVLILSDAKGVAVDFIGDPSHDEDLRRAGLYRGSDWSERLAGTCAVGTCITTGEALTVHLDDHFAGDHVSLTCTAAPIYSWDGSLAAVLDISALRSPAPKTSQYLALDTVKSFAHRIETASLHNAFRRDWIIHLSRSREFADIEPDLAIAIDPTGRIVGFNSQTRHVLDAILNCRGRDPSIPHEGLGLRFEDLFETSIDELPELTRAKPVERRVLRLRGGESFFALALEPAKPQRPSPVILVPSQPKPTTDPAVDNLIATDSRANEAAVALLPNASLERAAASLHAGLPVLIQGESGTGKELLARALHRMVSPPNDPFLRIDCAAFVDPYYKHALFGVDRPARDDPFSPESRGTLFLDGLNALPQSIQSRLMDLLETTCAGSLGRPTRIISAARADVALEVENGRFRPDLFYRLKGATLRLPPLRDRKDLSSLIIGMLRGIDPSASLSTEALAMLLAYRWPGNIRELEQVLKVAASTCREGMVRASDLDLLDTDAAIETSESKASVLEHAEKAMILRHLQIHDFDVAKTASSLSMSRATMYRKIKRFGL